MANENNVTTIAEFCERDAIDDNNILNISFCSNESLEFVKMPVVDNIGSLKCKGINSII